jgi:hypothetical protein
MIKTFEFFNDLDPYGEEDWNNDPPIKRYFDLVKSIGALYDVKLENDVIRFSFPSFATRFDYDYNNQTFNFIIKYNDSMLQLILKGNKITCGTVLSEDITERELLIRIKILIDNFKINTK